MGAITADTARMTSMLAQAAVDQDGYIEIAHGYRSEDRKDRLWMYSRKHPGNYLPLTEHRRAAALARRYARLGHEVYVGTLPRTTKAPDKTLLGRTRLVWVDLDHQGALARAKRFPHPAHMVVASGGGGAHLYWLCDQAMTPDQASGVCKRLARHLAGDMACTDPLRLMRMPGTVNTKPGVGRQAAILADRTRTLDAYPLGVLLDGVEDLPAPAPVKVHHGRYDGARDMDLIPAPVYFTVLAGIAVPPGGGMVRCPHADHEDRTPSARVYRDGWHCFGCGAGWGICDLASALEGGPTGRALRGEDFARAARTVRDAFHLTQPACAA